MFVQNDYRGTIYQYWFNMAGGYSRIDTFEYNTASGAYQLTASTDGAYLDYHRGLYPVGSTPDGKLLVGGHTVEIETRDVSLAGEAVFS